MFTYKVVYISIYDQLEPRINDFISENNFYCLHSILRDPVDDFFILVFSHFDLFPSFPLKKEGDNNVG